MRTYLTYQERQRLQRDYNNKSDGMRSVFMFLMAEFLIALVGFIIGFILGKI